MATKAAAAVVEVLEGPGSGQRLLIAPGETAIIGRAPDAQLSIQHAAISRHHVELSHRHDGVFVRDLGSKHGAVLDGRPLPRAGALVALQGQLELGKTKLRIARGKAPVQGPPGIELREKLGEGGAGSVYAGWQDPPGRSVAVKVVPARADALTHARVRREAELQARLDHPSIVRVHGLLESDKKQFLVRELVNGHSLDRDLVRGALPWRRAVEIGVAVAAALAHAHERGIVHRDVKPANILVEEPSGAVKLADFDLARDADRRPSLDGTQLTKTGDGVGTIHYIAPEQLTDAKHASAKADVYGLAAALYHALVGQPPFFGTGWDDYARELYGRGPRPLDDVAPKVPKPLRALVTRGLAVEPEERPDAAAFGRELLAVARST